MADAGHGAPLVQPVEPGAHAQPVRLKAFRARERFRRRADGAQRLRRHAGQRRALEEVHDRQARGEAGRAGGGKDVVRAAHVVADGLGRPAAHEDRAGVADAFRQRLGVLHAELEMFGRDPVRQRHGLVEVAGHDDGAVVAPARARDGAAVERLEMAVDGGGHAVGQPRVGVSRIDCALSSCSAWDSRSSAIQSGSAVPSAITRISDGPAIMSMPTCPKTRRLAAAT
jgi:hypothetical protein